MIIRGKSGAVFFTLDTLIAGLIITVTIMLVMSIYSSRPIVEDTYHELSNYVGFVSTTTMKDVRDRYQFAYDDAYEEDLELYIYQKVYKLLMEGEDDRARDLVANLTIFIIPDHLGFGYVVGNLNYTSNSHLLDVAKTSLTSRLLTYYVNDSVDGSINYDITEISVWS